MVAGVFISLSLFLTTDPPSVKSASTGHRNFKNEIQKRSLPELVERDEKIVLQWKADDQEKSVVENVESG